MTQIDPIKIRAGQLLEPPHACHTWQLTFAPIVAIAAGARLELATFCRAHGLGIKERKAFNGRGRGGGPGGVGILVEEHEARRQYTITTDSGSSSIRGKVMVTSGAHGQKNKQGGRHERQLSGDDGDGELEHRAT